VVVVSSRVNTAARRFLFEMMRFSIPPKLFPNLRQLQAQSKQLYTDKIVESEDAVVMTLGFGDAIYLTFDERVIVDEWNYPARGKWKVEVE
jgi:ethanolamine utilization protein EutQ (cupin superfamily)